MILGIGIDLLNISRIEALNLKFQDKFAFKILSEDEFKEYNKSKYKIEFLSKRFCVKEAFSKALGTGMGRGINFVDITVKHDILGKPIILLSDKAYSILESIFKVEIDNIQINVSITDEKPYVNSFVVISSIK